MTESNSLLAPGRALGVIGAGVMGKALIQGLLNSGLVSRPRVWASARTQSGCDAVAAELGVTALRDYGEAAGDTDIVLVCVKPAQFAAVATVLRESALRADTLLISVLAGVSTERLEGVSKLPNPWVRAVPNTPAVLGHGMTAVCGGRAATGQHLAQAQRIFSSVGRCVVVEERYCNAITALSGSGPAYMYLVMEALSDAGVRVGLPRDLALQLAAQTMLGSARMVLDTGRHPASLRDDVTTPAGCTIAGLMVLEDGRIRSVLARAVEEAVRVAGQLGLAVKDENG